MIRNPVLETYHNYKIKEILKGTDLDKYTKWETAVMNHEAVRMTLQDPKLLIQVQ